MIMPQTDIVQSDCSSIGPQVLIWPCFGHIEIYGPVTTMIVNLTIFRWDFQVISMCYLCTKWRLRVHKPNQLCKHITCRDTGYVEHITSALSSMLTDFAKESIHFVYSKMNTDFENESIHSLYSKMNTDFENINFFVVIFSKSVFIFTV